MLFDLKCGFYFFFKLYAKNCLLLKIHNTPGIQNSELSTGHYFLKLSITEERTERL